jgi:glutamate-ammonia-ligase adenylyltransferase
MERVESSIRAVVCQPRDPRKVAEDVADMRARIAQQFPGDRLWDLKYCPGGLIDIEFLAQYLQLRHGATHPELAVPGTLETLERATAAGVIPKEIGADLQATLRLWHKLVGYLRLTVGSTTPVETWPDSVRRSLVAAGGAVDFGDLERNISELAARTRRHFTEIVGVPTLRQT